MERITVRKLYGLEDVLNKVAGTPMVPWKRDEHDRGKIIAQVGNYHIYGANGRTGVHQISSPTGGVRTVFGPGTKRETWMRLTAFIDGMIAEQERQAKHNDLEQQQKVREGRKDS